jgi:hypothetical protein
MIKVGQYNRLAVLEIADFGALLDAGDDFDDVWLPAAEVPTGTEIDQVIEVFLYFNSHDELIATVASPKAQVGDFCLLRVVSMSNVGAFVDWGLPKDLLVPFSEQRGRLDAGQDVMLHLYTDKASGRIVGTTKFNRFLDKTPANYKLGEEVKVIIAESSDLGYKAVIEGTHWGLLFKTESFGSLFPGKRLKAYIQEIRPDGKINLSLQKPGKAKVDDLSDKVLATLEKQQGFLPLSDKSTPEAIFKEFRTSKATFKKTIGALYKQGLIVIEKDGIRLNDNN